MDAKVRMGRPLVTLGAARTGGIQEWHIRPAGRESGGAHPRGLVVPRALFPQILEKLRDMKSTKAHKSAFLSAFGVTRDLLGFLTYRCSKEVLSIYLEHDPELLHKVCHPGLYLEAVSEVDLAERFTSLGSFQINRGGSLSNQ